MAELDPTITLEKHTILPAIESADFLNAQIAEQNQRLADTQGVFGDEPEILELVEYGIAEEQQETFTDLSELGRTHGDMFEALGRISMNVDNGIKDSSAQLEMLKTEQASAQQEFDSLTEQKKSEEAANVSTILTNVERLSPKSLESVKQLLEGRLEGATSSPEIRELKEKIATIKERIADTEIRLFDLTQKREEMDEYIPDEWSWLVPQALVKVFADDTEQWVAIDELPVEPKLSPSGHEEFTNLKEKHVDQPEASIYTALYLADHVGETVDVDQLARFLYSPEVIDQMDGQGIRSRITTLLGPEKAYVSGILASEGFILQYGWRTFLGKNGDDVTVQKCRQRIYRAVAFEDLSPLKSVDQSNEDMQDQFEITPEISELLAKSEAQQAVQPADIPERIDVDPPREQPVAQEAAGSDKVGAINAPEQAPSRQQEVQVAATREAEPQWAIEFREDIIEVISKLEEQGLLESEEGEIVKVARAKSQSRVFGTDRTLNKLRNAGHMQSLKGNSMQQWRNQVITPAEMVIMELYNTHKNILGKKHPRRQKALQLIDERVDAYFKSKPKR